MASPRVRLEDVAKAANVSLCTASLALRGSPLVAKKTQDLISAVAAKIGYSPDALGAALASRRNSSRSEERQLRIGYFSGVSSGDRPNARRFLQVCARMGYDGEVLDLREYGDLTQAGKILWSRGIHGIIMPQGRIHGEPEDWTPFAWDRFSVVKLTRARPQLRFHYVQHNAFEFAEEALRRTYAEGAKRLGVLLVHSTVSEDDDARLGAILNWKQERLMADQSLDWKRPHDIEKFVREDLGKWLREYRPDTVMAFPWSWLKWFEQLGIAVPDQIRFTSILASGAELPLPVPGCARAMDEVMSRAVELLHRSISIGDRGMSDQPMNCTIPPRWEQYEEYSSAPPVRSIN